MRSACDQDCRLEEASVADDPPSGAVFSKRPAAHSPMPASVAPLNASDKPVISADLRTTEIIGHASKQLEDSKPPVAGTQFAKAA